jgi:hypothetical protein
MKITPERLRQIIEEEVKAKLAEQEDDYKAQSRRDFLRNLGKVGAGAAGFGASGGLLGKLVGKEKSARAQRMRDIQAANIEAGNSFEGKIEELQDYINNPAAFRWGKGEESMMQLPGSAQNVGGLNRGIDVLPPTYAIAAMVLRDKLYGVPDKNEWEGRFGVPDQQVDFGGSFETSPQQIQISLDNFFNKFKGEGAFLNTTALSDIEGIRRFPSSGLARGVVVPNPSLLFATPDYVLPENGMTVKEYYNWLYYNQFLSLDEIASAPEESEARQNLERLFIAANPELYDRMQNIEDEM